MRIQLLVAAFLTCTLAVNVQAISKTNLTMEDQQQPNIVLLIGDDHGASYFGFMGNDDVVTPNMDMIASGGVTFTQGYSTANHCRPALRTLITGLHPVQYKMRENDIIAKRKKTDKNYKNLSKQEQLMWDAVERASVLKEFDTLPKLLSQQGYATWQGGKWWENSYKNGHFDEGMTTGWDMSLFGHDDFFHEMMGAEGNELGRTTMKPLFQFIDKHKKQPFFIWYGPMLPHTPLNSPYQYRKHYDDKNYSESAKMYYGNVSWWDDGVGKLIDEIQRQGLLEYTLFIYINDNGWEQEPNVEYKIPGATYQNNLNFSNGGGKGKLGLYDQSFRTPVIFYWKDKIQGTMDTRSLISMEDIVPTILDIVGAEQPKGLPGYSLRPLLAGATMPMRDTIVGYAHQRRSSEDMMGQRAEGYYVRTERWFFQWYKDTGVMKLFDVTVDPKAENDLIDSFPHLIPLFKQQVQDWKDSIGMTEAIPVS